MKIAVMRSDRGFTFIESLVAAMLLGIVALIGAWQMGKLKTDMATSRSSLSRDNLTRSITNLAGSPAAIAWSAKLSTNQALANCVSGEPNLNPCVNGSLQAFDLYLPNTPIKGSGGLTANDQLILPAFYNAKTGAICANQAAPSEECPMAAGTSFKAFCPRKGFSESRPSSCPLAEFIEITYFVQPAAEFSMASNNSPGGVSPTNPSMSPTPNSPAKLKLREMKEEVTVPMTSISPYNVQRMKVASGDTELGCLAGEVAIGLDGFGNLICQKADYKCPPGTLTVGLDKFGRPIYQVGADVVTSTGEFEDAVKVRCVNPTCAGLMTSMFNGQNGIIKPECLSDSPAWRCNTSVGNSAGPRVVSDVNPNGVVCSEPIKSCYQTNATGSDSAALNLTTVIDAYNANLSDGTVVSQCESYKCGPGIFFGGTDANGNCIPAGAAVVQPPTTMPPLVVVPPTIRPVPPTLPPASPPTTLRPTGSIPMIILSPNACGIPGAATTCTGSVIWTLSDLGIFSWEPVTYAMTGGNVPVPPGAQCLMTVPFGTYGSCGANHFFYSGPPANMSDPAISSYSGGACHPAGHILSNDCRGVPGSGSSYSCCSGNYTCTPEANPIFPGGYSAKCN